MVPCTSISSVSPGSFGMLLPKTICQQLERSVGRKYLARKPSKNRHVLTTPSKGEAAIGCAVRARSDARYVRDQMRGTCVIGVVRARSDAWYVRDRMRGTCEIGVVRARSDALYVREETVSTLPVRGAMRSAASRNREGRKSISIAVLFAFFAFAFAYGHSAVW
jgi:hypothetical protein